MPETATPSGPAAQAGVAPAAQVGEPPTPFSGAANVIAPGLAAQPSGPGPSGAHVVPGVAAPGVGLPGAPDLGSLGVAGLPSIDQPAWPARYPVWWCPPRQAALAPTALVQAPGGRGRLDRRWRASWAPGTVGSLSSAIALVYLLLPGLLPNVGLPSPSGLGLPAALGGCPRAAAALPGGGCGCPAGAGLPAAPALPALPAAPALPALPALPLAPPAACRRPPRCTGSAAYPAPAAVHAQPRSHRGVLHPLDAGGWLLTAGVIVACCWRDCKTAS